VQRDSLFFGRTMPRRLPIVWAVLLAVFLSVAAPGAFAQTRLPPEGFGDLAERLMPAVVNVSTTQRIRGLEAPHARPDLFGDGSLSRVSSLGSGFVISAEGVIVTNNHVIEGADEIEVVFANGERLPAKVVGRDTATDIAVLRISAKRRLTFVRFGDASKLRVGDLVIAIGNPFGLGGSVSAGIVSARNRNISAGRYDDFIQTDAAINRGNSGGPLFNMQGEVVGVNTAIASPSGGSVGVGFAAPSDLVSGVVNQILRYGETRRGWLGVRIAPMTAEIAHRAGLPRLTGAVVGAVTPNSPAAKAGLRAGDIVLSFAGRPIEEARNLSRIVADAPIGKSAPVEIVRGSRRLALNVTVERLEEKRDVALATPEPDGGEIGPLAETARILGITVSTLTPALRDRYGLPDDLRGLVIASVDSGADAYGKVKAGDVIVEIQFEAVETITQARRAIDLAKSTRPVLLYISRDGDMTFRSVQR
jgi:serine protease Do